MSDAIDASMLAEKATRAQSLLDLSGRDAGPKQLGPGNHTVRCRRDLTDHLLHRGILWSHCDHKSARWANSPPYHGRVATLPDLDPPAVSELGSRLTANVRRAVKARDAVVRDVLVALFAEGHVLIEDYPGVGKTALARALARSIDAEYARVQCTADLLPADVVGTNVFNQRENRFEFRPGPVFANVVLVDEVNRASPKTQSGLLECMQERHVTVDKHTHELAAPFLVLATQNPIEYEGTYPLPEAQLDRFMVRVSLGYPSSDEETDMLAAHGDRDRVLDLESVTDVAEILAAQAAAGAVHGSEALRRYIVAVLDATRADPRVDLGASPRAGLMLFRAAKALAALEGRDHALPDDVQALAPSVLPHRLLLAPDSAGDDRAGVVRDALDRVPAL
jgi:MoxR-like ATPase